MKPKGRAAKTGRTAKTRTAKPAKKKAAPKVKWVKSPPELVALFASIMPGPPVEPRKMFGYPAGFVGGNMFGGLFQDKLILRLGESDRASFLGQPGAAPFEPM